MKYRWKSLALFMQLLLIFPCAGNQSNFSFNHLSKEQRLPGASVHCVFQDHLGLMWFAIESVGLCKYDGENFTVYETSLKDTNTISNNFPLCIEEDARGNLWIGTTEGLNKFDRKQGIWTRYLHSPNSGNTIPNNYITDLFVDKHNNLWIATREGASKYLPDEDKFCNFLVGEGTFTDGLPAWISCFYEDENENIWIGSYSSGLFRIKRESNIRQTENSSLNIEIDRHWFPIDRNIQQNNYAVQQVCKFDDNNLLLGKIDGLFLFNLVNEQFSKYNIKIDPALNNSTTSAFLRDKKGRLWVSFANKGLLLINSSSDEEHYFHADKFELNGIKSNSVRDIYEDSSGLIWIATKFQGIHTYDDRQEVFNKHPYNNIFKQSIGDKFVLSILEDSKKNIWIGTKNSGVYKYKPNEIRPTNYSTKSSSTDLYINDDRVESIVEDKYGNIWIGTEKGLNKLDDNKFIPILDYDYFTRCLMPDKNGNIWIGTNSSGVFYHDSNKNKTVRYKSEKKWKFFENNTFETRSIKIISDSLLWISTFEKGLIKYNLNKDELTHYFHDPNNLSSISGNMVRDIVQLDNGEIWVSTKSNGLNIYNSVSDDFTRIKKKNGLPPNTIYNILQDDNKQCWMGSHEGLVSFNNQTNEYILYNKIYGLKNNIFEVNAKCKTSDGILLFGGSEGLNAFRPEEVYQEKYKAPLIISTVKVYDKIVAEDINDYSELSISYNEKYIFIGFALIDYSDPLAVKYKYKLENFDKEWIECNTRNNATYTSLPPGEYLFKVLAANSDNTWMEEPVVLKIIIDSPFWRKPAFLITCFILIVVFALITYVARLRFVHRNEKKLRELVEEKTNHLTEITRELKISKENAEQSDRLKSAFLANMSHEIRTPMNGILGFAELLKEPNLSGEKQSKYIEIIVRSGSRMLNIINDIVDISKIEAGLVTVDLKESNINEQIEYVYSFFKPEAESKGIIFNVVKAVPDKEATIITDREKLYAILINLIKNAIKYTNVGEINFGYTLKSDGISPELEFFVKDTGIGIQKDRQGAIFERFIQADIVDKMARQGAGLGLSISKAYIEMLGGRIGLESKVEKGTRFYFTLPYIKKKEKPEPEKVDVLKGKKEDSIYPEISGLKILIAEDDKHSEMLIAINIQKFSKNILKAVNGIEAVEICKENPDIDLVLMDIQMPEMNGYQATKEIRNFNKEVIIIAQTAYGLSGDREKALDAGCNDYISKPINNVALTKLMIKYFEH